MAAPHSVDPAQLLEEHLQGASPNLLREMIATFASAMMSAQADQVCGAAYGERCEDRTNRRNGYRAREWDTRAGTVELAVPKLRQGSFFPDWLLTHRRRAEQALVTVVATAYLLGVSTRRVERLAGQLGVKSLSLASQRDGLRPRRPGHRVPPASARRRPLHLRVGRRADRQGPRARPGGQRARPGRDRCQRRRAAVRAARSGAARQLCPSLIDFLPVRFGLKRRSTGPPGWQSHRS